MKRRVAIFYKTYRKYGGQESVIYNFSHFLASKGYKVDVWAQKIKDFPEDENVTLHRVFIPNLGRGFRNLLFSVFAYLKAKKLKKKGVIILGFGKTFYQDIFRAGGGVHKFYTQRALLRYRSGFFREFQKLKRLFSFSHWINVIIEKFTFESDVLKKVIVPTEFVKKQIVSSFEVDVKKIVVIRNGVDLKRFNFDKKKTLKLRLREKYGISNSEFIFSFVSTNHRLKGLEYLLDAVVMLKEEGFQFKLIVAGNGDEGFFKSRIRKLGLENFVIYLGKVNNIEEVYFISDTLVYPTLFDASANVILESMASGTPVIASVYSGTHELIDEFENGLVIREPTNVYEIYEKMKFVLENRKLVGLWGKRSAEKMKLYPKEKVFHEYERLLSQV